MLDVMLKDREKFIPKTGFNVVGVDEFEDPGEQLYLIGHAPTQGKAKRILAKFQRANPHDKAYIYPAKTK